MTTRRFLLAAVLAALAASPLRAQTHVDSVLSRAHAHLVAQQFESALQLLSDSVLAVGIERTPQQTAWAQVLRGLAFLQSDPPLRERAQLAFLVFLRTDSTVRADTVLYLDYAGGDVARQAIAVAHTQLPPPPPPPPTIQFTHARDTTVTVDGTYQIVMRTTRVASTAVWITDSVGMVLWSDSLQGGADSASWAPRTAGREPLLPGSYTLHAVARAVTDSSIPLASRTLILSRIAVDTQATPTPPTMRPETQEMNHGSPGILVGGLVLGAAAVYLPTAMGHPELNTSQTMDNTAYVAAGAIAVASIAGWLTSHRTKNLVENHQWNHNQQQLYEENLRRIADANRQRIATAGIRIQVEGAEQ